MTTPRRYLSTLLLLLAALMGGACGDDDDGTGPGTTTGPLYAMMVQVYDADDRTVYVYLSSTLDLPPTIDLAQAREFPGVANFAPIGGRLLISSGEAPEITSFVIDDDLRWFQGETISFLGYPFEDNANFYSQYVVDDHTVYLPYDITKRVIWDPTAMEIVTTLDDTSVPLTMGDLQARVGGNRNAIRYDGPVQQAFFYTSSDWLEYGPSSVIAIYDGETHEEQTTITVGCPALSMASQDEQGYTYYGTWSFVGLNALFGIGPEPCIVRLTPDHQLDTAWTTDLKDLTEGRYHNNFRYIGGGRAIANVLHHELLDDVDWGAGYDVDVEDRVYASGPHWRLWLFDLGEGGGAGAPISGIDVDLTSGAQFAVLDGRTFLFVPYDDWGRSKIYEILSNGTAVERSDTAGDVFKWIRVR